MTTPTPELIRYMAGAATTPVPSNVAAKAKHHILDTIAAMVSGATIKPGEFALRYIEQLGGKPEAQVVASGHLTSALNAAWANGMLAHSDETDDSNGSAGIHPGCAVIPAALAADTSTPQRSEGSPSNSGATPKKSALRCTIAGGACSDTRARAVRAKRG